MPCVLRVSSAFATLPSAKRKIKIILVVICYIVALLSEPPFFYILCDFEQISTLSSIKVSIKKAGPRDGFIN